MTSYAEKNAIILQPGSILDVRDTIKLTIQYNQKGIYQPNASTNLYYFHTCLVHTLTLTCNTHMHTLNVHTQLHKETECDTA